MTPAGIEPATFRFVAQHLNHCTTAVPNGSNTCIYLQNSVKLTANGGHQQVSIGEEQYLLNFTLT